MKAIRWTTLVVVSLVSTAALAENGNQDNPECLGTQCGAPKEEGGGGGGGCGCGCGCSVWVALTDDGKTLAYTDDADNDGKADDVDNCPVAANRDQLDNDGDGVGNSCDNCGGASNFSQLDSDGDGSGDACDGDIDGDSIANAVDNCPAIPNVVQTNSDLDGLGDSCDSDDDDDGVRDVEDNCDTIANPAQQVLSDARCSIDTDRDGVLDSVDNCVGETNGTQVDTDGDGLGDVCDRDIDNDGVLNVAGGTVVDNCPGQRNRSQYDDDGDGLGDACDSHFCVVVDKSHPEDCLDPQLPFKVSGGGSVMLKKGEKFMLPLFANRNVVPIKYVWTVKKAPAGSSAAVINPRGTVTNSKHWLYNYVEGSAPTFTADVDGEFDIQLQAELTTPDRTYPDQRTSVVSLKMTAMPDGGAASCSAVPVDAGVAMMLLAMTSLIRRRRRHE